MKKLADITMFESLMSGSGNFSFSSVTNTGPGSPISKRSSMFWDDGDEEDEDDWDDDWDDEEDDEEDDVEDAEDLDDFDGGGSPYLRDLHAKAVQGNPEAQRIFGYYCLTGHGIEKDEVEAAYWWKKAAKKGDAESEYMLYEQYRQGLGVQKDMEKAIDWLKKSAEHGYVRAQLAIGTRYNDGKDIEQDYSEAARWLQKDADQGESSDPSESSITSSAALTLLGDMYYYGRGVKKDRAKAAELYALSEHINAQRAARLLRQAAERGDVTAQFELGQLYEDGHGVEKNETEAAEWYRKAAEQGYGEAQEALSKINKKTDGTEKQE